MPNVPWVVLEVLPRMTDKLARSLAGGPCVHFARFRFGYGWISGECPNFVLQVPPSDTNEVPGRVYEGRFGPDTLAVDGGRVVTKCLIPRAAVSEPTQVSAIVLVDTEGDVIAAGSFLPGWIVPDGEFEVDCILEMKYARGENG